MEYSLRTEVMEEGRIVQTLVRDQVETLSRWVANVGDDGIKQALIGLGWTPPKQHDDLPTRLRALADGIEKQIDRLQQGEEYGRRQTTLDFAQGLLIRIADELEKEATP